MEQALSIVSVPRWNGYSEKENGLRATLPGPILLPGETAVRYSTLYCYLFRLEYIFNTKTSLLVFTCLWPILFYCDDFLAKQIYTYIILGSWSDSFCIQERGLPAEQRRLLR